MAYKSKYAPIEKMNFIFEYNGIRYDKGEDLPIELRQHIADVRAEGVKEFLQKLFSALPGAYRIPTYYALMRILKERGKDWFCGAMDAFPVLIELIDDPDFDFDKYIETPIDEIKQEKINGKECISCELYGINYRLIMNTHNKKAPRQ